MTRRILALALLFCLLFPAQAAADVIVTPEDGFYQRHAQECAPLFRWYQANGEAGYVPLFDQPGGTLIANIENGCALHLTYAYPQNGQWGYTELDSSQPGVASLQRGGISGWLKLSSLRPVYDSIAFREAHASEIRPFSGDLSALLAAEKVCLWTYPGSPPTGNCLSELDEAFQPTEAYTDQNGLLWGRIGYYRGWRDSWVCISDPGNENLPVSEPEQPPLYPAAPPPTPGGYLPIVLAAALVAFTIGLTLFLLRRFWGRRT